MAVLAFPQQEKVSTPEPGLPKQEEYILIPEGIYEVQYLRADKPVKVFGPDEYRLYVHWQVVTPGKYFEARLFQAFKWYLKWPFGSKFYCNWTLANNGQKPRALKRMSCQVFKNKIFSAAVRTVKPRYKEGALKGKEKHQGMWYSIVDELIEMVGP